MPSSYITGRIHMVLNHVHLVGNKSAGKWRWLCEQFPELAIKHSGNDEPFEMIEDYLALVAGKVTAREATPRLG